MKFLVCGDVCGQLDQVFERVRKLQPKAGPFDALFCVGRFLAEEKGETAEDFLDYVEGKKQVPIPTYFVDGGGQIGRNIVENVYNSGSFQKDGKGYKICENLYFLGRQGIATIGGLSVAFFSGLYDPFSIHTDPSMCSTQYFTGRDIEELKAKAKAEEKRVDILLTALWPKNILRTLGRDLLPRFPERREFRKLGSIQVTDLSLSLSPRYHFAGKEGIFFQRVPFESVDTQGKKMATRFLSLAPISTRKEPNMKWMYALSLSPENEGERYTLPEGTGPSPFLHSNTQQNPRDQKPMGGHSSLSVDSTGTFSRWGNVETSDQRKRRRVSSDLRSRPAPSDPRSRSCWFCLGSDCVETHLVTSIGTNAYVALAKGGIIASEHVLVIPVEHCECQLRISPATATELEAYKSALRNCYTALGKKVLFHERYIHTPVESGAGNNFGRGPKFVHMHLQVCPIPESLTNAEIIATINKLCDAHNLDHFYSLGKLSSVGNNSEPSAEGEATGNSGVNMATTKEAIEREMAKYTGGEMETYMWFEMPDTEQMFYCVGSGEGRPRIPMQFGREVVCSLLQCMERVDWRACQIQRPEEERAAERFKKIFEEHDFTLVDDSDDENDD